MKHFTERLPRAITVRTYSDAHKWVENFVKGNFNLLFLVGSAGLAKSQMALAAIGQQRHAWIEGHATKLAFYGKLFQHRDEPVIIDDENTFVQDAGKLALMNSLCQTNPVKTLRWDSTTRLLEELNLPSEFQTTSRVLVISNRLRNLNPQTRAMLDRGQPILFQPSPTEIHRAVADWFTDKEIYDFIGEWIPLVPDLSMRDYVKAREKKKAGFNWKALLHQEWKCSRLARVLTIRRDQSFANEDDRVAAFEASGGSRATYYRDLARLRRVGLVPRVGEPKDASNEKSHSLTEMAMSGAALA